MHRCTAERFHVALLYTTQVMRNQREIQECHTATYLMYWMVGTVGASKWRPSGGGTDRPLDQTTRTEIFRNVKEDGEVTYTVEPFY